MFTDKTYISWLDKLLNENKKIGKTQKELAKFLNIDKTMISKIIAGKRRFQPIEIQKTAEFFGVMVPLVATVFPIDIIGKIGAGGHIETVWETGEEPLFRIYADVAFTKEVIGYQVSGDSMMPQFEDGDIVVVEKAGKEGDAISALNKKDAVVFVPEEGRYLKKILPGSHPGYFNLYSNNAPIMLDKPVVWASSVKSVIKTGEYDVYIQGDDLTDQAE